MNNLDFNNILNDCDCVMFDFDGTLMDTDKYHIIAHNKVISDVLGRDYTFTHEQFAKIIGKKDIEIFADYKKEFNVNYDVDEIVTKKTIIARDLILDKSAKLFDYFDDVLKVKGDKKFYIASNQDERLLFPVLKEKGIYEYFEKVFCCPEMNIEKEYLYNHLSDFIDHNKNRKLAVFEDSKAVTKHAKELGFITIGVESDFNRGNLENLSDYLISY